MVSKIREYEKDPKWQVYSKTLKDLAACTYWVFADSVPFKHIEGQIEGAEYFAI